MLIGQVMCLLEEECKVVSQKEEINLDENVLKGYQINYIPRCNYPIMAFLFYQNKYICKIKFYLTLPMSTTVRELEPKEMWNHFADLNAVPRPSKKEERIIEFMMLFGKNWAWKPSKMK